MKYTLLIFWSFLFCGCGSDSAEKTTATQSAEVATTQPPQLNITLLMDLSDRIDTKKYPEKPEHYQRDISNIKYFTELFIKDMEKRGTFMSKGKLKVIFSPKPPDPNVNIFAEKLNVDLSAMDNKQKKYVHDHLTADFTDNITKIYNTTLSESKWLGSDIWRFFKNDVKDYCIEGKPGYRNILVIFTDGYIYHRDSKDKAGNRYAFLLPEIITKYKLRNNQNFEQELEKQDFGLLTKRNDLTDLEVLVLEVSPSPSFKNDEDIIKAVLAKWFTEMKVKRYAIFNSDLPEYTKQRINDFIKIKL